MDAEAQAYYMQNEEVYKNIEKAIGELISRDKGNASLYVEQLGNMANGLRLQLNGEGVTFKKEEVIYKRMLEASYQRERIRKYNEGWQ